MPSRVLVVDDDPNTCELIQEVLTLSDIESSALHSGSQALDRVSREKFDAIFLDVRMPPPDGIALTRKIRASGLNVSTPIVIITGEEDNAVLARAFEAGANFFLFKPIDRHRMMRLIRVTTGSIENEARRYQRVKVRLKASIEWGQKQLTGETLDVSLGGMFVEVPQGPPLGATIQLGLELEPGSPPWRVAGRVVRSAGADCVGVQFENAAPDDSMRLQKFLLPLILAKGD